MEQEQEAQESQFAVLQPPLQWLRLWQTGQPSQAPTRKRRSQRTILLPKLEWALQQVGH